MQTQLLCWQIKPGDPTSFPAGEKKTETSGGSSLSDPERSFPMTLERIAEAGDAEPTAESPGAAAALLHQFVQSGESGLACEMISDRSEPSIDIEQILPQGQGTVDIESIAGIVAPSDGGPSAAAADAGVIAAAGELQPENPGQAPSDSLKEQAPAGGSNRVEIAPAGSSAVGASTEPVLDMPATLRTQTGAMAAAGSAGSDSSIEPLLNSAGTGSDEAALRDPPRPAQMAAAPLSQGNRPVSEPVSAAEPDQPQPAAERGQASRNTAARQTDIPSAAGDRPVEVSESPVDKDTAAKDKDSIKSSDGAQRALGSADRVASENSEPTLEKAATDMNARQPQAATNDSRLSQPTGDLQALGEEQAKAEKPNPAEIIDQIVKKAVIRLRDGHSEARIELKPELLGHLRLQISTENQQVTLRILTENPLVKEIIESSAAQLRADLQGQGLQMEELEVGVSGDHARFGGHPDESNQPQRGTSKSTGDAAEAANDAAEGASSPTPAAGTRRGIDTFA